MRVLVTGSSGFVGRHLVPRLRDEGDDVFVLSRGSAATPPGAAGVVEAPAELASIEPSMPWPDGIELVIHLAALNPARGSAEAGSSEALMRANAEGTARLAQRAAEAGASRFLFLSTANVHAAGDARAVIEDDALQPQDAYAASKLEGERRLRETLAGTATRHTILRPAPVYGLGGGGALAALAKLAAGPFPLPFAALGARRSVLAVENLVDAVLQARAHPGAMDDTFLVADDDPPTLAELAAMMRAAQGRARRQFALHPSLVRTALAALGRGEMGRRMTESFTLDTSRIRLRLGWRPRLPTQEALADMDAGARERSKRR